LGKGGKLLKEGKPGDKRNANGGYQAPKAGEFRFRITKKT
jgi:hypothetical protein